MRTGLESLPNFPFWLSAIFEIQYFMNNLYENTAGNSSLCENLYIWPWLLLFVLGCKFMGSTVELILSYVSEHKKENQVFKSLLLLDTEIPSVENLISVFLVNLLSVLLEGFLKIKFKKKNQQQFLLHLCIQTERTVAKWISKLLNKNTNAILKVFLKLLFHYIQ